VYADNSIEHRVKIGGDKDSTLFPSPPGAPLDHPLDRLHFFVPVQIRSSSLPATTTIRCEFWTPTGHNVRDERRLQLTAEHRRSQSGS
jgi:hypothetical protein